jgi:hypothetical protein
MSVFSVRRKILNLGPSLVIRSRMSQATWCLQKVKLPATYPCAAGTHPCRPFLNWITNTWRGRRWQPANTRIAPSPAEADQLPVGSCAVARRGALPGPIRSPRRDRTLRFIIPFNSSPTLLAGVGHHQRETRKDIHLSAMRAHLGAYREREFHLVKRPLQIRRHNGANYSAAFVALDSRLLSSDDALKTAATVGCTEIGMR